jgi:hypothetical protein
MARDPGNRYQTPTEMIKDMGEALDKAVKTKT